MVVLPLRVEQIKEKAVEQIYVHSQKKFITKKYPNGDEYIGEMKDDLAHGLGLYKNKKTGGECIGTWDKNLQHGVC